MRNKHAGSSFDDFLEEEGILDEVDAVAIKRVVAYELAQSMSRGSITKTAMARRLETSRSQLNRLLDPENTSVSLTTLAKAATVLGKKLKVSFG